MIIQRNLNCEPETFNDVLVCRAGARPEAKVYQMLSDDGSESGSLTFGQLERRARSIGGYFENRKARGERALLLYPAGLDYITAFYGCLYGGVIAVPAYPPRMNRNLSRLVSMVADSAPAYVLTDSKTLGTVRAAFAENPALASIQWIATDTFDFGDGRDWTGAGLSGSDIAFLQYTSGSTSTPKGVIVTHANLLRNEQVMRTSFELGDDTVIVSWLPMYHDMGLIGNVLAAVYNGVRCHLMSPAAFLRRPATWLGAISRYGATASGGPNFAYDLCVQKVRPAECEALDLSSWRIAFNGAEPVRAKTLERFAKKFGGFGFRSEAFFPCYGMAETTLFVSGGNVQEAPVVESFDKAAMRESRAVVRTDSEEAEQYISSGRGHLARVVIVDPATGFECPDGLVGEIWVADASVARGYWGRPELSDETFGARLTATNEGPFLRTGDLGVKRNCELFVMGRLKDLIIIRGRNHYPQDIELTAESAQSSLRPGCTVAFAVDADGEEQLILVAEVMRERRSNFEIDDIGESIHRAVAAEHGVTLSEIVLVQPASTLKTSSGKIQRSATRQAYVDAELDVVAVWRNRIRDEMVVESAYLDARPLTAEELQSWVVAEVAAKLSIPAAKLDVNRPIAEYGLDSLGGVELLAAIEEKLGLELPFDSLFVGEPSLARLSKLLLDMVQAQPADAAGATVDVHVFAMNTACEVNQSCGA